MILVARNEMDWKAVRKLFPAAQTYTYLNSAAAPPLSLYAAKEGKRYYDEMLQHGDIFYDRWLTQVEEVREKLAHLLHAQANQLAFTYSSSHGMNLVAQILAIRGEVLTPADEFPSATLPWLQQRYDVRFVPSREHGIIDLKTSRAPLVLARESSWLATCSSPRASGKTYLHSGSFAANGILSSL